MDPVVVTELVLYIVLVPVVYMIPAIVAFWRQHPNRWVIFALNLCLGATGIVWLGCLVWAFMAVHISGDPNGSNGGESGLNLAVNDIQRVRIDGPMPSQLLPPPLPQSPRSDAIDRLERLKRLHDDGVIDAAQFGRMRDAIAAEAATG